MTQDNYEIIYDNKKLTRFELAVEGGLAFVAYRISDGAMDLYHTESPKELAGRGIASRLVLKALETACQHDLKVKPTCSFVKAYMERHPEYKDLKV
jgi:predicted GNAT family acetyltransferase